MKRVAPQVKWPKKLQAIFADAWKNGVKRAIVKAPRGGGKSQLIASLGFCLWYLRDRSTIDMGGSEEQAKEVYRYFLDYCYGDEELIAKTLPDKPTLKMTTSPKDKYFKCVTASPKQVRGPHPDSLLIDEACEAEDDLIKAALPMVGASSHPFVCLTSTFHKIFGIFQEVWDNAHELGYKRYSWDIFDVVQAYDISIWDDRKYNREISDFNDLKKLCQDKNGKYRTGDPNGWIPIENVIQAWREKPTIDWFLVEYMGLRPSAAGLVLNPEHVDRAFFGEIQNTLYNYIEGIETIIGIDWGFSSMTSCACFGKGIDEIKILLDLLIYHQVKSSIIIEDLVQLVRKYNVKLIYADSEAKFENMELQAALQRADLSCRVVEVVFGKEKMFMVGNLRAHFEQDKVKIPQKFLLAKWQLKRYRYQDNTNKPVKKDDHIPDSFMCAFQHWPLNRQATRLVDTTDDQKENQNWSMVTSGLMDKQF